MRLEAEIEDPEEGFYVKGYLVIAVAVGIEDDDESRLIHARDGLTFAEALGAAEIWRHCVLHGGASG